MKKRFFYLLGICITIMGITSMGVAADSSTYYDESFDKWNLNISADTENKEKVFNETTGGWILSGITGDATVSTVNATSVNSSWTNRGKILKVTGTDLSKDTADSAFLAHLPFKGYTYDIDRLYIEFDVFIPSSNTKFNNRFFVGGPFNGTWSYYSDNNSLRTFMRCVNSANGTPGTTAFEYYGQPIGEWQHIEMIYDGNDAEEFTFSNGTKGTNYTTLKINQTVISTNNTKSTKRVVAENFTGNLPFGGYSDYETPNNAYVWGEYYIDNVKVYTNNKYFAFSHSDYDGKNVAINTAYVDIVTNAIVDKSSLSSITVNNNADFTPSILEDGKTVRIAFNKYLNNNTTYTINFSGLTASGTAIATNKNTVSFTTNANADPYLNFDILKEAKVREVYGVSGIAMLAKFDEAPGQIYVSREITNSVNLASENPSYLPSCIAKVIDPNGNTVATYDFSHMDRIGKEYAVLECNDNIPGIWTIQIMNGRGPKSNQGGDIFQIGINGTDVWGLRGEKVIGSGSITGENWIYTQKTLDYIHIGTNKSTPFNLYDDEGKHVATSESTSRAYLSQKMYITEGIEPEKAYKVDFTNSFSGEIEIDGIPALLCPTKEAALELKGGWDETGGIVVQGPIQKRAREEIVRLINTKDLTVNVNKPSSVDYDSLDNIMAEAQLFGSYANLGGIGSAIDNQILDVSSPYLGIMQGKPITVPEKNWQHGHYYEFNTSAVAAMASIYGMDLDLNYLKGNPTLANRVAINLLGIIAQLDEGHLLRVANLTNSHIIMTGAMFAARDMAVAYGYIRDAIDPQTREILDIGMRAVCDKHINYVGQGPTNQALFCMSLAARMYNITGDERYHDTFKRQIKSLLENTDNAHGISDLGYFIEDSGCDGSYEYMNRFHYYTLYKFYKNLPNADAKLVEQMKEGVQKSLEFESFFWVPQPYTSKTVTIGPGNFTSRTDAGVYFGTDNYPGYSIVWDEFPLARRRFEMESGEKLVGDTYTSHPNKINSEDIAKKQISNYYGRYENSDVNTGNGLSSYPDASFDAFNATEWTQAAEGLPYEASDGTFWIKDGFVAFKHKGIYGTVFYGVDNSLWRDNYSVMGGGPTVLWGEGTGTTLVSKKHCNYYTGTTTMVVDAAPDVVSTCVYGNDADGNFIYSGKEGTPWYGGLDSVDFNWVEENKSFKISGEVAYANNSYKTGVKTMTGKTVSWLYDFANDGLGLSVSLDNILSGEEFWVNLPIAAEDSKITCVYDEEAGTLTVNNGEGSMVYSWDPKTVESTFISRKLNGVYRLRLKMSVSNKVGKVDLMIKNIAPNFTINELALYKDCKIGDRRLAETLKNNEEKQYISYRIRNNTNTSRDMMLLIAYFDGSGNLSLVEKKEYTLMPDEVSNIVSDKLDLFKREGTVKAFIWSDDGKIEPLTDKNEWTIKDLYND